MTGKAAAGLFVGLTCTPSEVDVHDKATEGARLLFGIHFDALVGSVARPSLGVSGDRIDVGFDLSPTQLGDLGAFLLDHARKADEYLSRYRDIETDVELEREGQFHFELLLRKAAS